MQRLTEATELIDESGYRRVAEATRAQLASEVLLPAETEGTARRPTLARRRPRRHPLTEAMAARLLKR